MLKPLGLSSPWLDHRISHCWERAVASWPWGAMCSASHTPGEGVCKALWTKPANAKPLPIHMPRCRTDFLSLPGIYLAGYLCLMVTLFSDKLALVYLVIVTRGGSSCHLLKPLVLMNQKKVLVSLPTRENFLRCLFVYNSKDYLILRASINGYPALLAP